MRRPPVRTIRSRHFCPLRSVTSGLSIPFHQMPVISGIWLSGSGSPGDRSEVRGPGRRRLPGAASAGVAPELLHREDSVRHGDVLGAGAPAADIPAVQAMPRIESGSVMEPFISMLPAMLRPAQRAT